MKRIFVSFFLFFSIGSSSIFAQTPLTNVFGDGVVAKSTFGKRPQIRVLIKKGLKKVQIYGTDLMRMFPLTKEKKVFPGRKRIKFNCESFAKRKLFKKPLLVASLSSATGLISLTKEKFKGLLHIVTSARASSCDVIHQSDIEDYISSLLSKEMNASWPIEALKAQAVAARTYALHKMESKQVVKEAGHETHYDLESSEKHQVGGSFFDSTSNTQLAAQETAGQILMGDSRKVTPTFFHAKCGGKTLRPDQVWTHPIKEYQGVECPYCNDHGKRSYLKNITLSKFKKFILWAAKKEFISKNVRKNIKKKLKIVPNKKFQRKVRFYLGDEIYAFKKNLLRRYFGRFKVPSNNFTLALKRDKKKKWKIRVYGSGLGHGVGMCQLGALDLANKGWDHKQILAHYFPGHRLKTVY
jgi:stage II sporulation protein D